MPRLDHNARASGRGALCRPIARTAVDDDDFADAVGEDAGDNSRNRRFFLETRYDRRNDRAAIILGMTVGRRFGHLHAA
jgi:hypothetical protein